MRMRPECSQHQSVTTRCSTAPVAVQEVHKRPSFVSKQQHFSSSHSDDFKPQQQSQGCCMEAYATKRRVQQDLVSEQCTTGCTSALREQTLIVLHNVSLEPFIHNGSSFATQTKYIWLYGTWTLRNRNTCMQLYIHTVVSKLPSQWYAERYVRVLKAEHHLYGSALRCHEGPCLYTHLRRQLPSCV